MDKAYIVANEQQEREVLEKLEREGCVWHSNSTKPTEYIPSKHFIIGEQFPTAIVKIFNNRIMYETNYEDGNIKQDEEIIYDGRKEEQMSEKYVVSKKFMYELKEWRKNKNLINELVWYTDIKSIPEVVKEWWAEDFVDKTKTNNRLIAIIRWVNGEDVFEVEKPKKWVVRSKAIDSDNNRLYVEIEKHDNLKYDVPTLAKEVPENATKFDTKEEAESWANDHQEVVEVEE